MVVIIFMSAPVLALNKWKSFYFSQVLFYRLWIWFHQLFSYVFIPLIKRKSWIAKLWECQCEKKSNKFMPSLLWAVTNVGVQLNLNSTPNKNINTHYLINAILWIIRKVSSWESHNEMEENSFIFDLPTGL